MMGYNDLMTKTPDHKLANGDLEGMDAGQLREHLLAYLLACDFTTPAGLPADVSEIVNFDKYTDAIIDRIASLLEVSDDNEDVWEQLLYDLNDDLIIAAQETTGYQSTDDEEA